MKLEHNEYGWYLWLTNRIRLGTVGTMTPMWPHVYRSGDEHCNDVLAFHLYPIVAIDIWHNKKLRTAQDGLCGECKAADLEFEKSNQAMRYNWIEKEFERAKERQALIPEHARLVVTKPPVHTVIDKE